jgi:hypothetical protein
MFRLALGRDAMASERDRLSTFFEQQKKIFDQNPEASRQVAQSAELAALTAVGRGLMNLDEFINLLPESDWPARRVVIGERRV